MDSVATVQMFQITKSLAQKLTWKQSLQNYPGHCLIGDRGQAQGNQDSHHTSFLQLEFTFRSKLNIPPATTSGSFSPGEEDESRDIVDYELTGVKVQVKYPKGFSLKARPSIWPGAVRWSLDSRGSCSCQGVQGSTQTFSDLLTVLSYQVWKHFCSPGILLFMCHTLKYNIFSVKSSRYG